MNGDGVWADLWRATAVATAAGIPVACGLAYARWRFDSLAVRVATTVLVLVGLIASPWLVGRLMEPSIQAAQSRGFWVDPSPLFLVAPAIIGLLVGGLFSRHLHQRVRGRVA